jgi:hypothetical protein
VNQQPLQGVNQQEVPVQPVLGNQTI